MPLGKIRKTASALAPSGKSVSPISKSFEAAVGAAKGRIESQSTNNIAVANAYDITHFFHSF
jgi:hypothetical protein